MRKAFFAVTFLMIASAAHASPLLQVAENDQPPASAVVITTEPTQPAPVIEARPAEQPKSAETPKATEPAKTAEPVKTAEPAKTTEPAVADTKSAQPQKGKPRTAHHESAEQTARRIAAKYGIYW